MDAELTDDDVAPAMDIDQLRKEYEEGDDTIEELLVKYPMSRRAFYNLVHRKNWRRRAPRRVDRNDVVERLLRRIESQILKLEFEMKENKTDESVVLGKLSASLDRLIALADATQPKRANRKSGKLIEEIREKVAQRLVRLAGH